MVLIVRSLIFTLVTLSVGQLNETKVNLLQNTKKLISLCYSILNIKIRAKWRSQLKICVEGWTKFYIFDHIFGDVFYHFLKPYRKKFFINR